MTAVRRPNAAASGGHCGPRCRLGACIARPSRFGIRPTGSALFPKRAHQLFVLRRVSAGLGDPRKNPSVPRVAARAGPIRRAKWRYRRSRRAGNGGRNSAADPPSTVRKRMSPAGRNLVASSLVSLGAKYLKTTFGPKALADFCDSCFASVERTLARMNGVGAEHEVVGMLDGRTQDEAGVFKSFEFEG